MLQKLVRCKLLGGYTSQIVSSCLIRGGTEKNITLGVHCPFGGKRLSAQVFKEEEKQNKQVTGIVFLLVKKFMSSL
jgi:hypothetical protein